MKGFPAVQRWHRMALALTDAAVKKAVQDMIADMEHPRAKGGLMPVDTGFLRNSGSSEGIPSAVALKRWKPLEGQRFEYGWTANYAPYMNIRFGFRDIPVKNWQHYVREAIKERDRLLDGVRPPQ